MKLRQSTEVHLKCFTATPLRYRLFYGPAGMKMAWFLYCDSLQWSGNVKILHCCCLFIGSSIFRNVKRQFGKTYQINAGQDCLDGDISRQPIIILQSKLSWSLSIFNHASSGVKVRNFEVSLNVTEFFDILMHKTEVPTSNSHALLRENLVF